MNGGKTVKNCLQSHHKITRTICAKTSKPDIKIQWWKKCLRAGVKMFCKFTILLLLWVMFCLFEEACLRFFCCVTEEKDLINSVKTFKSTDSRLSLSTCLNCIIMSFESSISLNIPSSLLVKAAPHSIRENVNIRNQFVYFQHFTVVILSDRMYF